MNIREVAERTGLTPDTLRWYEKIGLLAPVRKIGGRRDYSEREVRWIGYIKCMRRAALPVDAILEYIRYLPQKRPRLQGQTPRHSGGTVRTSQKGSGGTATGARLSAPENRLVRWPRDGP